MGLKPIPTPILPDRPRLHLTPPTLHQSVTHLDPPRNHSSSSTMSQFFLRIANYLANELIVKGLANNRAFQRFALRTADHVDKLKTTGVEHSDKVRGGCMSLWGTVRVLVYTLCSTIHPLPLHECINHTTGGQGDGEARGARGPLHGRAENRGKKGHGQVRQEITTTTKGVRCRRGIVT